MGLLRHGDSIIFIRILQTLVFLIVHTAFPLLLDSQVCGNGTSIFHLDASATPTKFVSQPWPLPVNTNCEYIVRPEESLHGYVVQLNVTVVHLNRAQCPDCTLTVYDFNAPRNEIYYSWPVERPGIFMSSNLTGQALIVEMQSSQHHMNGIVASFVAIQASVRVSRERQALLDLWLHTNGSQWLTQWDILEPHCTWPLVECNSEDQVTEITLQDNNLRGRIPESLSGLSHMQFLSLFGNRLSGQLPSLSNMQSLRSLRVARNAITKVHDSVWSLPMLEEIDMGSNNCAGTLPNTLTSTSQELPLKTLVLNGNQFYGTIPGSLCQHYSKLEMLLLNQNNFSGLPPALRGCNALYLIALSDNRLIGKIPLELTHLPQLTQLYLDNNQLSALPDSWNGMPLACSMLTPHITMPCSFHPTPQHAAPCRAHSILHPNMLHHAILCNATTCNTVPVQFPDLWCCSACRTISCKAPHHSPNPKYVPTRSHKHRQPSSIPGSSSCKTTYLTLPMTLPLTISCKAHSRKAWQCAASC